LRVFDISKRLDLCYNSGCLWALKNYLDVHFFVSKKMQNPPQATQSPILY